MSPQGGQPTPAPAAPSTMDLREFSRGGWDNYGATMDSAESSARGDAAEASRERYAAEKALIDELTPSAPIAATPPDQDPTRVAIARQGRVEAVRPIMAALIRAERTLNLADDDTLTEAIAEDLHLFPEADRPALRAARNADEVRAALDSIRARHNLEPLGSVGGQLALDRREMQLLADQNEEAGIPVRVRNPGYFWTDPVTGERMMLERAVVSPVPPDPTVRRQEIKTGIRAAILKFQTREGGWVNLADVRDELGDRYSRQEVDDALREIRSDPDIRLVPIANNKALTQRDHDAELRIFPESEGLSYSEMNRQGFPNPLNAIAIEPKLLDDAPQRQTRNWAGVVQRHSILTKGDFDRFSEADRATITEDLRSAAAEADPEVAVRARQTLTELTGAEAQPVASDRANLVGRPVTDADMRPGDVVESLRGNRRTVTHIDNNGRARFAEGGRTIEGVRYMLLSTGGEPASEPVRELDTPRVKLDDGDMTTTAPKNAPYAVGQRVEVEVTDFSKPGMPKVWLPGTVSEVKLFDEGKKLVDVLVDFDEPAPGGASFHREVVGPRGGGRKIRAVEAALTDVSRGRVDRVGAQRRGLHEGAAPTEPTLGVRETSAGRETTVTLPDGTTAKRTSKTRAYTHAVVATRDEHARARRRQVANDRRRAFVEAFEAWRARGSNFAELKAYPSATLSYADEQRGMSKTEYFLPGFEPTRVTPRSGRAYWSDDEQFSLPDPNDRVQTQQWSKDSGPLTMVDSGKTRLDEFNPDRFIAGHREAIDKEQAQIDELAAGPQYTYSVYRWSQSADNAFKAIGEFAGGTRRESANETRYEVITVGGTAVHKDVKVKAGPTAEEKAAAKLAKAETEKAERAKRDEEWVQRKVVDIRRALDEGNESFARSHVVSTNDRGLRMIARKFGIKSTPRGMGDRQKTEWLRNAILDKARESAPKLTPERQPGTGAVETDIRAAVQRLEREPGAWVNLARLRDDLGERYSKAEVDAALTQLNRDPDVHITPESNQKALTQKQIDAAVVIGNQRKHHIAITPPLDKGAYDRVRSNGVRSASNVDLEHALRDERTSSALYDEIRAEQKRRQGKT